MAQRRRRPPRVRARHARRPNYANYGRRVAIWFTMSEADWQDWQTSPLKAQDWRVLIPPSASQWRHSPDQGSNFGGIDRRGIYFVPDTLDTETGEQGKMTAFALRDLWEFDFQVDYPDDTYVAFFDYATGAASGEYQRTWLDNAWRGQAFYILPSNFVQSFTPTLTTFPGQAAPRWLSVTAPTGSRLGEPQYVSFHFRQSTGAISQAVPTHKCYLFDTHVTGDFLMMHCTDAPLATDFDKVAALANPITETIGTPPDDDENVLHESTYKVDTNAFTPGQWDTIVSDRQVTNTWSNLKAFIVHSETGAPLADTDVI